MSLIFPPNFSKTSIAFFEAYGIEGVVSMEKLIKYVKKQYPDVFTIADAKRGDIGNSSSRYAKAFFEKFGFTVRKFSKNGYGEGLDMYDMILGEISKK